MNKFLKELKYRINWKIVIFLYLLVNIIGYIDNADTYFYLGVFGLFIILILGVFIESKIQENKEKSDIMDDEILIKKYISDNEISMDKFMEIRKMNFKSKKYN